MYKREGEGKGIKVGRSGWVSWGEWEEEGEYKEERKEGVEGGGRLKVIGEEK